MPSAGWQLENTGLTHVPFYEWQCHSGGNVMKISIYTILAISLFVLLPLQMSHSDDTVYGWQLMTEKERIEHRNKMQSMKTKEEREAYRSEHHMRMQERAKKRGVTLPDRPQPRGKGMRESGGGKGKGPGGGRKGY